MMHRTRPSSTSDVLLVEGQSDKHLVWQLCSRNASSFHVTRHGHNLSVALRRQATDFLISEKGSRSELIKSIRQEVEVPSRRAVGILVDVDEDLERCWEDVAAGFSRTNVQLPSSPEPTGTIVPERDGQPRTGIWLMPDNGSHGEIEDFVLSMMPKGDRTWPLSDGYIESIPLSDRKFSPGKSDKAKLHAWLATRSEPGRMGAAVGHGDLEINGQLCQNFLLWLERLFG